MDKKRAIIISGGTIFPVRSHFAICAPAFGEVGRHLATLSPFMLENMNVIPFYTAMANMSSCPASMEILREVAAKNKNFNIKLLTNNDISILLDYLIEDDRTKIIFMAAALCDFEGKIGDEVGRYASRLRSDANHTLELSPADKLISKIRKTRKDIFLVGFKQTCGASADEQYIAGLKLCKASSCNLVLANDTASRLNMIVTPEEARYAVTKHRVEALTELVQMAKDRSHLTFTRSTVVAGKPIPWTSNLVPETLRKVVNYCIEQGAYKPFGGATAGHFACKLNDNTFLTSIRKTDFNKLNENGLVRIETDGPDTVLAYGAKPSVGGQSQRIVFSEHKEYDCIVHFHCPIKAGSLVPIVSQKEFECGSMACGQNTSRGLKKFGDLSAVYLNEHGPNIVFHQSIDPQVVIDFINENFDLSLKTGGFVSIASVIATGNDPEMTTLETAKKLL